jgi:hypothetical protein
MSIVSVVETNETDALWSPLQVNCDRNLVVKSDDITENWYTVVTASGIPAIYSTYRRNAITIQGLICTSIKPKQRKDAPLFWDVVAHYDWVCVNVSRNGGNYQNDPVDWTPKISGDFVKYQVPCNQDIHGNPIVCSAGDPYDPPFMMDAHRFQLKITRYETSTNAQTALTYQDAVNSDTFWGVSPGYAKIIGIAPELAPIQSYVYWKVTYTIEFRSDGWNLKPLDKGLRCLIDDDGNPSTNPDDPDLTIIEITDGNNIPVKTPVPLDGLGNELTDGSTGVVYPKAGSSYQTYSSPQSGYEIYKSMAFSTLNLPNPGLSFASGVL